MKKLAGISALLLSIACQMPSKQQGATTSTPAPDPFGEARSLIEQGQPDVALAKLLALPESPENICHQGLAWAKKAEQAPLPTPPPMAPGEVTPPRAPEFKAEELRALDLYDQALRLRSDLADAYLAKAELLAPHSIRRFEAEQAARPASVKPRRGQAPPPTPLPPAPVSGPDIRPELVGDLYQQAARLNAGSTVAVQALLRFATRVRRMVDVEWGLQEMISRSRENPEPLIAYGDFLVKEKKDVQGGIARYREALIWRPDDEETKGKIAEIYLQMGREHFDAGQWSLAESRFVEGQKYATNPSSPQALKIRDYMQKLAAIRSVTQQR